MEVKGKSCGVRAGGVECVVEIHEEGVAPPSESVLDEEVGELFTVE